MVRVQLTVLTYTALELLNTKDGEPMVVVACDKCT